VTVWVDKGTVRVVRFKEHCMNEIDGLLRKTLRCRCFDGRASRPETRSGQDLRSRAAVHGHNFRATKAGRLPALGKFPVIPCCEGISSRAERADCGLCVRRVRSREEQPDIRRKNRRNIRRKTGEAFACSACGKPHNHWLFRVSEDVEIFFAFSRFTDCRGSASCRFQDSHRSGL